MDAEQLEQIQAALAMAVKADLITGVGWLDDVCCEEFKLKYPNIWQVITNIGEM